MSTHKCFFALIFIFVFAPLASANRLDVWGTYDVLLLGRASSDPALVAMAAGAEAAQSELEEHHRVKINLRVAAPREAGSAEQSRLVDTAFLQGIDGLLLDAIAGAPLAEAVNMLARQDIPTVLLRDELAAAPAVGHLYTDQAALGELALATLIPQLGRRGGRVAVLGGPLSDPSVRARLAGMQAAEGQKPVDFFGVFECPASLGGSLGTLQAVTQEDRDEAIAGWLFLGDWPLQGAAPLPWEPGQLHCVAIGAYPAQLAYLRRGYLDALVAPDYHEMGRQALRLLVEHLAAEAPPRRQDQALPAEVITMENLAEHEAAWAKWLK